MRARSIRSAVHRVAFAGLAGGSLAFRSGPDILQSIGPGADVTLAAVVLVLNSYIEPFTTVGTYLSWLLFAHLLYLLTPRLYPKRIRHLSTATGFRFLVVSTAMSIALAATYYRHFLESPGFAFLLLIGWGLLGSQVALLYFVARLTGRVSEVFYPPRELFTRQSLSGRSKVEWDLDEPPELVETVIATMFDRDADELGMADDRSAEAIEDRWETAIFVLWFPALVAGLLITFLFKFHPLTETVLLGGVALVTIERRMAVRRGPVHRVLSGISERSIDLERHLLANIGPLVRSEEGRAVMVPVVGGIALSAYFFGIGSQLLVDVSASAVTHPQSILNAGIGGLLLLAGMFGFWYWLLSILRLPSYLRGPDPGAASTSESVASIEAPSDENPLTLPVRPPGYFLPGGILVLLAVTGQHLSAADYGIAWGSAILVGLLLVGGTVWHTVYAQPQPGWTESRALPLAWTVEFLAFSAAFVTFTDPRVSVLIVAPLAVAGLEWFYFVDVQEYSRRLDGVWRYGHVISWVFLSWYWTGLLIVGLVWLPSAGYLTLIFATLVLVNLQRAKSAYIETDGG